MTFNEKSIEFFGQQNGNMAIDSSWSGIDERQGRLQTYLDFDLVKSWVLKKHDLGEGKISILDVGAGKGRMTRHFARTCKFVVSIEPILDFYKILNTCQSQNSNVECHNCTLAKYCNLNSKNIFDLIYISGVTPYLDDSELNSFFLNIKKLLKPNGRVIIRELGSTKKNAYEYPLQINRTYQHINRIACNTGFRCVRWRRAYPSFLLEWFRNKYPSLVLENIRILGLHPIFYPVWAFLARLNIPTRLTLSRGQEKDYFVYLFQNRFNEIS